MATIGFLLPSVFPSFKQSLRRIVISPSAVLRPPWERERPRPAPSPAAVRALVAQFVVHELDRRQREVARREHELKAETSGWFRFWRLVRQPWVSRVLILVVLGACLLPPAVLLA